MKLPESCPICEKGPITTTLEDYSILVSVRGEQKALGGLTALQCSKEAHIFFVLTKDVEEQSLLEKDVSKSGHAIGKTPPEQLQHRW